jgi:hypothetical protein
MRQRLLEPLAGNGAVRASGLSGIKRSWVYTNPLTQWVLTSSPTATHLLENLYSLVLNRVQVREAARDAADGIARLATLQARFPDALGSCDDAPIIVLSAGWRSGSTLVQRVLMSSEAVMIWGEPFARSGLVPRLLDQLRAFTPEWPAQSYLLESFSGRLTDQWIANIYPGVGDLIAAQRGFLLGLLAEPARRLGRECWGFKEVRLDGSHARFLKLLFPKARIVFLVRSPYDSYASFRHYIKSDFVDWPGRPVLTPAQFGRMWHEQVRSFREVCAEVDGLFLRYEDFLADPAAQAALSAYVGLRLEPPSSRGLIPTAGQSGSTDRARPEHQLLWWERRSMRRAVGDVAVELGYRG